MHLKIKEKFIGFGKGLIIKKLSFSHARELLKEKEKTICIMHSELSVAHMPYRCHSSELELLFKLFNTFKM
jgi:hypothetical protein